MAWDSCPPKTTTTTPIDPALGVTHSAIEAVTVIGIAFPYGAGKYLQINKIKIGYLQMYVVAERFGAALSIRDRLHTQSYSHGHS